MVERYPHIWKYKNKDTISFDGENNPVPIESFWINFNCEAQRSSSSIVLNENGDQYNTSYLIFAEKADLIRSGDTVKSDIGEIFKVIAVSKDNVGYRIWV